MLTFAYKVGGWVWQNAYVIIRISLKSPNWPQIKTARVCKFLRLRYKIGRYKFDHYCQIVHFSSLNEKKNWFTISISSSKVSTTYFWKRIQVFVFWIPSGKKIFSVKYLPICLALKGFKKHVKSCFFVYSKYWMKNNSTIIKGNVNILKPFCWKKQMDGLFKTFFIVLLYYC